MTTSAASATADNVRIAPTAASDRITNLDTIRGLAVLGILGMNAVAFGLPNAAYYNLDAASPQNWLDWAIGWMGEVFFDQKMMGLFSVLFGASIVLFADRAAAKGRRANLLSLWRNFLLLLIGIAHSIAWEGDVLIAYAICSPVLVLLRNKNPRILLVAGVVIVLSSAIAAAITQSTIPESGEGLGDFWFVDSDDISEDLEIFEIYDPLSRALGMMLIGVALYRFGVLQGRRSTDFYRKMALFGLLAGLPLAALGVVIQTANDFSPSVAIVGLIPNTIGTIPAVLGFIGLITLWNQQARTWLHVRIQAVGRMALTNYLTQTMLGLGILTYGFEDTELTRTGVLVFVLAVWAPQIAWSKPWLDRFNYGPFEWLWRVLTYRSWQPFRRAPRVA